MKKFIGFCLLSLASSLSSMALAGWHSGGGELIKDGNNPWFLSNTVNANYCIKISPDFPIQDHEKLDQSIRVAINFWEERIKLADPYQKFRTPDNQHVKIGPQAYRLVDCDGSEAITFQFGYLDDLQRRAITQPEKYAALTIRTQYDDVNLQAKGFIFVSTDRGPNAFRGNNLVSEPWTLGQGNLLRLALTHEIGHIYGISHMSRYVEGHGDLEGLMDEEFVESILDKKKAESYEKNFHPSFLIIRYGTAQASNNWGIQYCFRSDHGHIAAEFFAMQIGQGRCLKFELNAKTYRVSQWDPAESSSDTFLGTVNLESIPGEANSTIGTSNFPVSRIYLTPKQKVIKNIPDNFEGRFSSLESVIFKVPAKFRSILPISDRPMMWSIGPGRIDFAAQIGDRISERVLMPSAHTAEQLHLSK